MPESLQIHDAVATDAPEIAGVHLRSWVDTYGAGGTPSLQRWAATWGERLARQGADEQLLVAVVEGAVVGFVWAGPTRDTDDDAARVAQIRSLHVDPQSQGRGVGRRLLREVADRLSAVRRYELSLWVVHDNAAARAFYEQLGWKPDGTQRRELLAMPGETGPVVKVARYRSKRGGV